MKMKVSSTSQITVQKSSTGGHPKVYEKSWKCSFTTLNSPFSGPYRPNCPLKGLFLALSGRKRAQLQPYRAGVSRPPDRAEVALWGPSQGPSGVATPRPPRRGPLDKGLGMAILAPKGPLEPPEARKGPKRAQGTRNSCVQIGLFRLT